MGEDGVDLLGSVLTQLLGSLQVIAHKKNEKVNRMNDLQDQYRYFRPLKKRRIKKIPVRPEKHCCEAEIHFFPYFAPALAIQVKANYHIKLL